MTEVMEAGIYEPTTTPPKKRTFMELLQLLEQADEGMIEFSPDEIKEIGDNLREKVDSIKYVLDKLEAESERLKKNIDEFSAVKKSIDRNYESLETYVGVAMASNKWEKLVGEKFEINLKRSEKIVMTADPNSEIYLAFPDLAKREYAWDKRAFDAAFKARKYPELEKYCAIENKVKANFKVRKDNKK
jgi:hypothetical protein